MRLYTERREKVRRYVSGLNSLSGLFAGREIYADGGSHGCQPLERASAGPSRILGRENHAAFEFRKVFGGPDHAVRIGIREWTQEDSVHDAEHRRVCANAESERSDGG